MLFLYLYICIMQRYFIELSYNGTDYFGWQKQPKNLSVQEVIETELSKLQSNQEVPIVGCGRTDTGVHAKHYFAHVDLPEIADLENYRYKLNKMLPSSVAVHRIFPVAPDQHARFGAKARTYRYFVHHEKDAFLADRSWYVPQELNFDAMNEAAKYLLGTQDFTSLSKLHTDVKTNICTVTAAHWILEGATCYFEITADRFLRNMVRATVGTLVDVGLNKLKPEKIIEILAVKDRGAASTSVPAHGLFLWKIEYDGL